MLSEGRLVTFGAGVYSLFQLLFLARFRVVILFRQSILCTVYNRFNHAAGRPETYQPCEQVRLHGTAGERLRQQYLYALTLTRQGKILISRLCGVFTRC